MTEEDITRVIQVFNDVGARWALVGAHATGMLTTPRATADFDFIVEERKLPAVLNALREAFGDLGEQDIGAAVRLTSIDVDLIRSGNHPLFTKAIDHVRTREHWFVPRAEVIIVLKYLSAVSPWRNRAKRAYDVGDLRMIYATVGRDQLDLELMKDLSALVYPGAEQEFMELLERIDRGEPIEI